MSKKNKQEISDTEKKTEKTEALDEAEKNQAPLSKTKKTEEPVLNFTSRRVWPD